MDYSFTPGRRLSLTALSSVICFVVFLIIDAFFMRVYNDGWSVIPALSASLAVALITYLLQTKDHTNTQ